MIMKSVWYAIYSDISRENSDNYDVVKCTADCDLVPISSSDDDITLNTDGMVSLCMDSGCGEKIEYSNDKSRNKKMIQVRMISLTLGLTM